MASSRHPRRRTKLVLALFGGGLALLAGVATYTPGAHAADDIDLLRKQGGTPYVFFLIDTSGSMALDQDDNWVPLNGDDPNSKIYQVKEALYDVMSEVENVHFGLAGFNQDRLHVRSKHWVYQAVGAGDLGDLTYPLAAGEEWVFGRHVNDDAEAGTCSAPLDLATDLDRLNRFSRLGVVGGETTLLWVRARDEGGEEGDHRIEISPAAGSPGLGSPEIRVRVEARRVIKCNPPEVAVQPVDTDVTFRLVSDFLMVESNGVPGAPDEKNCTSAETMKAVWPFTDVLAKNTCGSGSNAPFTGQGWDGNTDSGAREEHEELDACWVSTPGVCGDRPNEAARCGNPLSWPDGHSCYNLRFPTVLHPSFPELDFGDHIPFHWDVDYQEDFLRRMNPRHPNGRDFGIASYFQDRPDSKTELLHLRDEGQRPLIAFGNSPLGRAINDFRCWYLGGDNKCKGPSFSPGWEAVFRDNDLEYGCRVPYLIIISDGEDNSKGENPSADTANLWSKAGVRTFAFVIADEEKDVKELHSIVRNGKGELILVENGDALARKLREVIGFIQEESRTFASAAVPSVQAAVEDKIYLTEFTPLNEAGLWQGHVHSFLKPLPVDDVTRRPILGHDNHLWDAAEKMLDQSPEPATGDTSGVDLKSGTGVDQRRVFYAGQPDPLASPPTSWADPTNRRRFYRSTNASENGRDEDTATAEEADLWAGLGLSYDPNNPDSVRAARQEAFSIIEKTLIQKTYTSEETGDLKYILGDIFHSNPLVIGSPVNTLYFIQDAEETFEDQGGEQVAQGTGYRQFFLTHENRRKIVVAGANDGMLHAWDAGRPLMVEIDSKDDDFGIERQEVRFDNGTGREIFAYIPRSVLPAVSRLAKDPVAHIWSVDGTVAAGDVFIDPLHGGNPDPAAREWRTVLIGGLREGGSAYYALDITHPDLLTTATARLGPEAAPFQEREVFLSADRATPRPFDPNDPKELEGDDSDSHVVPDCIGIGDDTPLPAGCPGPLPYAAPLWEFTDRIWDLSAGMNGEFVALDEENDSNDPGRGQADLGETWSTPDIGRIRVIENGVRVNKYVAIFGGGLDPVKANSRGNFLYIVDFETGEILYKRQVEGSVPSDPAAVDTNQDGFFDRVYFGTTAGFMYRLDLVREAPSEIDRYPKLVEDRVRAINGRDIDTVRIERGGGEDPLWEPVAIFTTEGRPIYYPPTVLFIADSGRHAIGFGTGERDALGFRSNHEGRFYNFIDDSDLPTVRSRLPLDETSFTRIEIDDEVDRGNLLSGDVGRRGWFMPLALEERLISPPAGLIGVTFFATFEPHVTNETCEVGPGCNENPQCSLSGNSRIYVVGSASAEGLLVTVDDPKARFMEVSGFVTEPFTEQGLSRSRSGSGDDETADDLTEREREIMESLQKLMPANCRFGNHRIDIKVIGADTRLERIAAVPICIIEKNWMEVTD